MFLCSEEANTFVQYHASEASSLRTHFLDKRRAANLTGIKREVADDIQIGYGVSIE